MYSEQKRFLDRSLVGSCLHFSWGLSFLALPSAPPSFSGDGQRTSAQVLPNLILQIKLARVWARDYDHCKRKREVLEKVGGALRYTLISTLELARLVREAREGRSNKGKKEGAR